MGRHHDRRFPNESDAYRKARDELLAAEAELRAKHEDVAELRRRLPDGGELKEDYSFAQVRPDERSVRFSELFEDGKDSLLLYSFMFDPEWDDPCPACSSFADSLQGIAQHVTARTNLAVVAKAAPEKLAAVADQRGWNAFRFLSGNANRYAEDYHSQYPGQHGDGQHPILNVFVRRAGVIRHFWASELFWVPWDRGHPRHIDTVWPIWNLLDLTPEGRGGWFPKLEY